MQPKAPGCGYLVTMVSAVLSRRDVASGALAGSPAECFQWSLGWWVPFGSLAFCYRKSQCFSRQINYKLNGYKCAIFRSYVKTAKGIYKLGDPPQ